MAASRCPEPDKLRAYALGENVGGESQSIESHLVACAACQATLQNIAGHPTEAINRGKSAPLRRAGDDRIDFLLPAVLPDEIGRLANYRVLRVLGSGGMGIVFLAEDISLQRRVALKVMRPELHENPDGWKRFLREARTMAAIKHDHLVTIYQAGQERDVIYFAMELLEGVSLETWMERNPKPSMAQILSIGKELATGLAVLHQKGLIHRDIKPGNIWLEQRALDPGIQDAHPRGSLTQQSTAIDPQAAHRVKILDLGLVRTPGEETRVTQSGMVIGTPAFMSPEQARGVELDSRTDLFSMGSVLYSLCTGRAPFEGNSSTAVLMALAADDPPAVAQLNPEAPQSLSDLIMQLLERKPEQRPATAHEVYTRLCAIEKEINASPSQTAVERKPARPKKGVRHKNKTSPSAPLWPWYLGVGATLSVVVLVILGIMAASSGWFTRPDPPSMPAKPGPGLPPFVVGDRVYLADLAPIAREHWPFERGGPDPKDAKKKKAAKDSGPPPDGDMPVRYQGKLYPKGIFMHPPPPPHDNEPASLSFDLGRKFKNFAARISLNDGPERSDIPLTFSVYGDGKRLWQSRPLTTQEQTQDCAVDVSQVQILKIEVRGDGPPLGAHAVWLDPIVTKASP